MSSCWCVASRPFLPQGSTTTSSSDRARESQLQHFPTRPRPSPLNSSCAVLGHNGGVVLRFSGIRSPNICPNLIEWRVVFVATDRPVCAPQRPPHPFLPASQPEEEGSPIHGDWTRSGGGKSFDRSRQARPRPRTIREGTIVFRERAQLVAIFQGGAKGFYRFTPKHSSQPYECCWCCCRCCATVIGRLSFGFHATGAPRITTKRTNEPLWGQWTM